MVSTSQSLQSTTQKYLEIFDITNDLLMLHDGTCSMVLKTSAINFDLFSEEEQDATIYAYAALLNSLSFPIEIVIRSQKKDVTAYLDLLKTQEVKAYTPLKKKQIREYRGFVEQLVQERNVLDKKFYVIITASAVEMGLLPASSLIPTPKKETAPTFDKYNVIEKALTVLQPRRDHLIHQLARIGLVCDQLKTQELIQLFYSIYNPEASDGQKIQDSSDYTTPVVAAQLRTTPESAPKAPTTTNEPEPAQSATVTPSSNTQTTNSPYPNPEMTKSATPTPIPPQSTPQANSIPVIHAEPINPVSQVTPPAPVSPISTAMASIKEDSFTMQPSDLKPPTPPNIPAIPLTPAPVITQVPVQTQNSTTPITTQGV